MGGQDQSSQVSFQAWDLGGPLLEILAWMLCCPYAEITSLVIIVAMVPPWSSWSSSQHRAGHLNHPQPKKLRCTDPPRHSPKGYPQTQLHLREGDGEVEALPQASEGNEGLRWEAPGAHFTVGMLILAGRAHTVEASNEQVHAGAPIFAYSAGTAA